MSKSFKAAASNKAAASSEAAASKVAAESKGAAESDGPAKTNGYLLAVMVRCDVYRHNRARKLDAIPSPVDVFDIVNSLVAAQLAKAPLILPSFTDCVDPDPPRRRKLKRTASALA